MALDGAVLDVSGAVITGNVRTGIYYHTSSGKMSDSVVRGNASYGLAMHECFADVEYAGGDSYDLGALGNYIFGNPFGLPTGEAGQVTANPKGLPAPPAPSVSKVSFGPLEER